MDGIVTKHLRHEEQSKKLIGLIYEVHNRLKVGWAEETYHQALVVAARDLSLPVESKPRKTIVYRDEDVHTFECDLIAWNQIILELKVFPHTTFASPHYAQLIHYLKAWNMDLGMLVNFGPLRVELKRVAWDEKAVVVKENFDYVSNYRMMEHLSSIRECIHRIGEKFGLGYPATMYRNILGIELRHANIEYVTDLNVAVMYGSHQLLQKEQEYILASNSILIRICSLVDYPSKYEFTRMKNLLMVLGLETGLIVNFGKRELQIFGVPPK